MNTPQKAAARALLAQVDNTKVFECRHVLGHVL